MSENYQYATCKHCGQSIMEGQIHNCRKMYLAEIADCHATMLRQEQKIVKLEKALRQISQGTIEPGHVYLQATRMQDIASLALEVKNDD